MIEKIKILSSGAEQVRSVVHLKWYKVLKNAKEIIKIVVLVSQGRNKILKLN